MAPALSNFDILRALLRPIVRFCLRRSLKTRDVYEALKWTFVECAREQLESEGFEVNTSRVSVMTGLQRRDVMRIDEDEGAPRSDYDVLRRIMGHWQSASGFTKKGGGPRELSHIGKDSEFAELVREVSSDINPYTVLFELERLGVIDKNKDKIALKADALSVRGDAKRSLELLSADMDDLIRAVEDNGLKASKNPHHHIKTSYDNVATEALPEIREWMLEEGAKFHQRIRKYLSAFDKDINPKLRDKRKGSRVALGSFSFIEEAPDSREEEK